MHPSEQLLIESREEAGIGRDLIHGQTPSDIVNHVWPTPEGLEVRTSFVYDVELQEEFEPRDFCGETDEFERWPLPKLIRSIGELATIKMSSRIVLSRFLARSTY
jgi:8-oxo-dGTP pyrophosphatase MutT (NUDIX family)